MIEEKAKKDYFDKDRTFEVINMPIEDVKSKLYEELLRGILSSIRIMARFLLSQDRHQKFKAAAYFVDKLQDEKFMKVVMGDMEKIIAKNDIKGSKIEWDKPKRIRKSKEKLDDEKE